MSAIRKSIPAPAPTPLQVNPNDPGKGELKFLAGSKSDDFNKIALNQAMTSIWKGDAAALQVQHQAIAGALQGIAPRDEVEGMLAVQMVACHNAAMECFRRAMVPEQPAEHRDFNLTQANKLTRSYATLVQALDKHRGKGQQTVRVEHVHVHSGGQAIVGNVNAPDRIASTDYNGRMEAIASEVLAPGGSE